MNSSMIKALNSMNSYQRKLDLIADNVANVNTIGYKSKSTVFEDLLNTLEKQPQDFALDGRLTPLGFNQGWGSRVTAIATDFSQGSLKETGVLTDMAIEGNALFEIAVDGQTAYTRDGTFQISMNANGEAILTTSKGYPVQATLPDGSQGSIIIPEGYALRVEPDGRAYGVNEQGTLVPLGTIGLVQPIRSDALIPVDDNLFVVASGANVEEVVARIIPDDQNRIAVRQGYLEQSNVDYTKEMTDLIKVQRAYQLAARALSSSDTMMQLANNLRNN